MSEYNSEFNPEPSDYDKDEEAKRLEQRVANYRARIEAKFRGIDNDHFLLGLVEIEQTTKVALEQIDKHYRIQREKIESIERYDSEKGRRLRETLEEDTKNSIQRLNKLYNDYLKKAPPSFRIIEEE
ncbi:MAG: hypothetical protein JWO40_869 [Candidatus Doudnabacteria bacterium]|nr:hypothetical protein [Candidatus Doudnabacteria bacterium]